MLTRSLWRFAVLATITSIVSIAVALAGAFWPMIQNRGRISRLERLIKIGESASLSSAEAVMVRTMRRRLVLEVYLANTQSRWVSVPLIAALVVLGVWSAVQPWFAPAILKMEGQTWWPPGLLGDYFAVSRWIAAVVGALYTYIFVWDRVVQRRARRVRAARAIALRSRSVAGPLAVHPE